MGKLLDQQLPVVQPQRRQRGDRDVRGAELCFCQRCYRGITEGFNSKCVFVVLLSLAVFVYALFSVLHLHSRHQYGFDAQDLIKISATVQAYFRLPKPVSDFVSRISELEDEIFQEIGIPTTQVAILSMHQEAKSNWTDVVFGVLSNPLNASISPAFLSLLRSSFLDIFELQTNLTLTNRTFGQPSSFEILKFPGGMTIIPDQYHPVTESSQILFNFTLNNSIAEIKEKSASLKTQLIDFLHLLPYEAVYLQVHNMNGSTRDPPVTVEASVSSTGGSFLSLERLRALAQIIMGHPAENLGLDDAIFGKVKEVRLSSILNHSLDPSPSPSPGPSPAPALEISPSPISEYDPPAPASNIRHLESWKEPDKLAESDDTHAFPSRTDSYGYRSLPRPHSASPPLLMHDSLKDLVSLRSATLSTSRSPLSSVPAFSHITVWLSCWFGLFMLDVHTLQIIKVLLRLG